MRLLNLLDVLKKKLRLRIGLTLNTHTLWNDKYRYHKYDLHEFYADIDSDIYYSDWSYADLLLDKIRLLLYLLLRLEYSDWCDENLLLILDIGLELKSCLYKLDK